MIRLSATSQKLQAVLAGVVTTNQLHCVVCYSDQTSTSYNGSSQYTSTNSTTAVDICDAPAASTIRDIDFISIRNRDTAAATVTVMVDVSATDSELVKATLAVGDQLVYTHSNGWATLDSAGQVKSSASGGVSLSGNNTWTGTQTFRDNKFEITDDSDTTKKLAFQCSGIGAGTTRTATWPNKDGTVAMTSDLIYKVVQRVEATPYTTYASDASGSLPIDNTIPQKTEGWSYVSQAFTPLYADSILVIEGLACVGGNGANTIGVFIADTAINDALAATAVTVGGASYLAGQPVRAVVSAASTSARTYELRIGAASGITFFVNGTTSARLFGGVMGCCLSITEFRPA